MNESKIVVEVWRDEGPEISATPVPLKRYRWPSTLIGLLGTIAVHGMILQSIPFGTHARPVKPPQTEGGAGATVNKPEGSLSDPLILLDLSSLSPNRASISEEIASQKVVIETSPLTILSVDALPMVDISIDQTAIESKESINSGDPALHAALFGRYTGQIEARIERLWKRPKSVVHPDAVSFSSQSEHAFHCQVRIIQDDAGNIKEVQLLQCDNSASWRQSLVAAILASSPLPTPSIQSIFSRFLTITFTGYEYTQGAELDGYAAPDMSSL